MCNSESRGMRQNQLCQYYKRINLDIGTTERDWIPESKIDVETLQQVHFAHVTAIPFENLTLVWTVDSRKVQSTSLNRESSCFCRFTAPPRLRPPELPPTWRVSTRSLLFRKGTVASKSGLFSSTLS